MLTLRFLASGDSRTSLTYLFRMGKKSVSRIVSDTCEGIAKVLLPVYMSPPETEVQWRRISQEFQDIWQFPHVVGALDGKHIVIEAPAKTGTLYHNYKGTFSIVLLAICDAKYNFTLVDMGQYGSNNDSGVLAQSEIGYAFERNTLNLPPSEVVTDTQLDIPYFLVGDEIFPLKQWLMRPYPGKLSEPERIYNYRQSRARRVIENAFGILRARWRIFSRPIKASVENTERYVMASLCLHNYLRQTENSLYTPRGFMDVETGDGRIKPGEWRSQIGMQPGSLHQIKPAKGGRRKIEANELRENLKNFLNSEAGSVSWQLDYVRSVGIRK